MKDFNLIGKTALITGGNRGIGKAIALRLAGLGAKIIITGRNKDTLASTIKVIEKSSTGSISKVVDVRNEGQLLDLFKEIKKKFGKLDICIPNAGEATLATTSETTLEDWNRDIETNLTGLFITSREALKMMKEEETGYIPMSVN